MGKRNGAGKEREGYVGDSEWRRRSGEGGLLRGIEHRVVRGNEDRRNENGEGGYKQGGNKGGD